VAAAAADEVSMSVATMFNTYAEQFQALNAQAATFHDQFVQALTASAGLYATAEVDNASPLQSLAQAALGMVNARRPGDGGTPAGTPNTSGAATSVSTPGGPGGGPGRGGSNTGTVITSPTGTTTIEGRYVVQNGVYNDPGHGQAITVTPTGFTVTAEKDSAPMTGAPLAYPSVYQGVAWGTASPGSPLPELLSQINTAVSSVSFTFPHSGNWDAAYDIWLNPTPITTGVNQQEIMILFNHVGNIQPPGQGVPVTVDGQQFVRYAGSNGYGQAVWYMADSPISSWNNMNVLGFVDNAETVGPVTNSWYLTSVQAGFEIWNGGVGASVNSFSSSVNGVS
jgi:hypothetical protein